jgi:hypothetical protein
VVQRNNCKVDGNAGVVTGAAPPRTGFVILIALPRARVVHARFDNARFDAALVSLTLDGPRVEPALRTVISATTAPAAQSPAEMSIARA